MPKLPLSPSPERLAEIGADERVVPAGTALFRIYFLGGPHPGTWDTFRYYGPLVGRFDPPLPPPHPQERGVMYLARHPRTCLAEVFQVKRRVDVLTGQPMLVGWRLGRDVRLLDLTGLWPTRAGASMAINSGRAHASSAGRGRSTRPSQRSTACCTPRRWPAMCRPWRCSSAPPMPCHPGPRCTARWPTHSCGPSCGGGGVPP